MPANEVYAIAGAKGGVGKTTTSINLGTVLADLDKKAVTVELDLAMANLVDFLDIDADFETATTLHDVLAGRANVSEATYETDGGLAVVPSGTDLDGYADTDLERLPAIIQQLRWEYDVILLDTPAGLSEETIRPMQLSERAIVISTPRVSSVRNAKNTIQLAERTETAVHGLVLTKSGTGASPGAARIAEFLDIDLLGHVPEDEAVPHAQDQGEPVVLNSSRSGAAIAYRKIAQKISGEAEPVADIEVSNDAPGQSELDRMVTEQTDGGMETATDETQSEEVPTGGPRQMDRTRPETTVDPLKRSKDDMPEESQSTTDRTTAGDDESERGDNTQQTEDDESDTDTSEGRSFLEQLRSVVGV